MNKLLSFCLLAALLLAAPRAEAQYVTFAGVSMYNTPEDFCHELAGRGIVLLRDSIGYHWQEGTFLGRKPDYVAIGSSTAMYIHEVLLMYAFTSWDAAVEFQQDAAAEMEGLYPTYRYYQHPTMLDSVREAPATLLAGDRGSVYLYVNENENTAGVGMPTPDSCRWVVGMLFNSRPLRHAFTFTYVDDENVILTNYLYNKAAQRELADRDSDLVIPEVITVDGNPYTVCAIGAEAFHDATTLRAVKIPSTVVVIGSQAFSGCTNLRQVDLGESVSRIYSYAFRGCAIDTIRLPRSVDSTTSIMAFAGCPRLKAILVDTYNRHYQSGGGMLLSKGGGVLLAVPAGIGDTLVVPQGVSYIFGRGIGCASLAQVTIPASVQEIDSDAFVHYPEMKEYEVDTGNADYRSVDGALLTKDGRTLLFYPAARNRTYVVPQEVTRLNDFLFEGAPLTSITLPDSLETIGNGTFAQCYVLDEITLPPSVQQIGREAFAGCQRLRAVHCLSAQVTFDTSALDTHTVVYVPDSLLADEAFMGRNAHVRILPESQYRQTPRLTLDDLVAKPFGRIGVKGSLWKKTTREIVALALKELGTLRMQGDTNTWALDDGAVLAVAGLDGHVTVMRMLLNGYADGNVMLLENVLFCPLFMDQAVKAIGAALLEAGFTPVEELEMQPGNHLFYKKDTCVWLTLTPSADILTLSLLEYNGTAYNILIDKYKK